MVFHSGKHRLQPILFDKLPVPIFKYSMKSCLMALHANCISDLYRKYDTNNNAARFQCGILHVHSKMDIHKRKKQDSMDFWGTKSKFCV